MATDTIGCSRFFYFHLLMARNALSVISAFQAGAVVFIRLKGKSPAVT